jgi:uncharacterized surface protein with fasciclin (FAS1) repeats
MIKKLIAAALVAAPIAVSTPASVDAQDADIVATAQAAGGFETLLAAATAADLVGVLQGEGPYTVFAPTDEAFAQIPEAQLQALLADKEALTQVLLYHVVPGKVLAADVVGLSSAETAAGIEVSIHTMGDHVMIDDATVVATDIEASNGVIHVIDRVILPSQATDGAGR